MPKMFDTTSSAASAAKPTTTANYTARMVLQSVESKIDAEGKPLALEPYRHFTLGCTEHDETERTTEAFDELAKYLQDTPLQLAAKSFEQYGPTWVVELDISEELRNILSKNFDSQMSKENDKVLYLWDLKSRPDLLAAAKADKPVLKTPHMSIGKEDKHRETAERLVNMKYNMVFHKLDYKRSGNHDPHLCKELGTVNPSMKP